MWDQTVALVHGVEDAKCKRGRADRFSSRMPKREDGLIRISGSLRHGHAVNLRLTVGVRPRGSARERAEGL